MPLKHRLRLPQFILFLLTFATITATTIALESGIQAESQPQMTPAFSLNAVNPTKEGKLVFWDIEAGEEVEGSIALSLLENDIEASFRLDTDLLSEITSAAPDPSQWIIFPENSDEIILKNKSFVTIPVKIKIPEGTVPGDYRLQINAVMQEYGKSLSQKKKEETTPVSSGGVSMGAKVNFATGMQAFIRVKGEITLIASLKDIKYEISDQNGLKFSISCQNDSNVSIIPIAKIKIFDTIKKKNILESSYDLPVGAPNARCGGDVIIENQRINQQSTFRLDYGIYEFNIDFQYVMLDFLTPRDKLETKNGGNAYIKVYHLPIRLIMTIVIAIIFMIIVICYRNYRYKKLLSACRPYLVQNGDTLDSVASRYRANAKIIVKINKIEFPFTLIPGTKILVPTINKK